MLNPLRPTTWLILGLLSSTIADVERARESYEKALKLGLKEAGEALQRNQQ
jgi:Tfp pilus assembly protein PilF